MMTLFEKRCLEAYESAGSLGLGRWLLRILLREALSLYKEYVDMSADLLEKNKDARRIVRLGLIFLAGTWTALFFLAPGGQAAGFAGGVVLVSTNALLVGRALVRSERIEYVAGMSAMANVFLLAGLMAVQASLGKLPQVAILAQVMLIGLHTLLLWSLRGEDLTGQLEKGE
jgi:hypothetical protein